jgi:hypothetical protein
MKRSFLGVVILVSLIGIMVEVAAQQVSNDANPLYRPLTITSSTISVPPIPGRPFSAKAIIVKRVSMPDGTVAESRNLNIIARDSRGRTHGETRRWLPASDSEIPFLSEVIIYDLQKHVRTVYNMVTHIAFRQPQVMPTAKVDQPTDTSVKVEDLGSNVLDGLQAKGTRRTIRVPGDASGTGAPIVIVDEYWYSDDLHLDLLLLHDDPRTGQQTIALSDLNRNEPDASLFEVPADFKVVELTPPRVYPPKNVGLGADSPKP